MRKKKMSRILSAKSFFRTSKKKKSSLPVISSTHSMSEGNPTITVTHSNGTVVCNDNMLSDKQTFQRQDSIHNLFIKNNYEVRHKSASEVKLSGPDNSARLNRSDSLPTSFLNAPMNLISRLSSSQKALRNSKKEKVLNTLIDSIRSHSCKKIRATLTRKFINVHEIDSLVHETAFHGCEKCLLCVIKQGGCPTKGDEHGYIPLHSAVMAGNIETLMLLLEHTSCINATSSEGWSALHMAVLMESLDMVHLITTKGGDPFLISEFSSTPFQLCIDMNLTVVLDYFIYSIQTR